MKNTKNIKTRIIAGILSAITVCSVGTMAIGSASAAETLSAVLHQSTMSRLQLRASMEGDQFGKKMGVDAAFLELSKTFPGAGLLISPFKSLFHANVDSQADPMAMISEKLDKMDQKLDEITAKLQSLNNSIDRNTAWLGNKVELSELKSNYRLLSANLEKFKARM